MDKKTAVNTFAEKFIGSNDPELIDLLDKITKHINLPKKDILFHEGQSGSQMYFLIKGSIKLFKTNEEGKEAVINFVRPNEIFAELILHLKNKYPVSSMAIEKSDLLAIDAAKLIKVFEKSPDAAMKLIAQLAIRIKYFVNMVENLTLSDVRGRFLNYLKFLYSKAEKNPVTLPVAKGDIALLLGTTPETFSRLLKKLGDEKIIKVNGKDIFISDLTIIEE